MHYKENRELSFKELGFYRLYLPQNYLNKKLEKFIQIYQYDKKDKLYKKGLYKLTSKLFVKHLKVF